MTSANPPQPSASPSPGAAGQDAGAPGGGPQAPGQQVVVVGPDGKAIGTVDTAQETEERNPAELVEQPAKVMRVGSMVKQLLEEVRSAPLDDAARGRLRDIHATSVAELSDGLAPELREELQRLSLPFSAEEVPSDAELRVAQAQLVGWLEGLFHGIQTALFAQQMAAKVQQEQRGGRALEAGPSQGLHVPGPAGGTGQYL